MDRNCLSDTTINTLCLEVLASAKKILGERLEKVILYGSYARRDYEEESDIDFFILADIPQE
ncbi:MAG: nucleotidyltransferase domain-containing protein, partial [Oscillospiraceae bacterium]|nr:nucleotidyltransferase domain-containing protein [Oscillospiraceae bacterium]MCL2279649.1 nucleotidyltransferase domain-containing protein [Oscillospiraceae bacterium]